MFSAFSITFLLILLLSSAVHCFEVALFANNGCYSHDVMMREVGEAFEAMLQKGSIGNGVDSEYRIHWLQIFMYDFGFGGPMRRPAHWGGMVVDREADKPFMDRGSKLLWEMTVPIDHNRPWNLRGARFLFDLLSRNQRHCEHFVKSVEFREFLREQRTELVVVDHFLQECFTMAASLLNASVTIQYSNWPIADGYISSLNIPAPPSAYPKTSTAFSAKEMNLFGVRLRNTLFHAVIAAVRFLQSGMIIRFFSSAGYPQVRLEQVEAGHLFYAGRAEFLAEPVRPISNRIKHFGCAYCRRESKEQFIMPNTPPADIALTVNFYKCPQQWCSPMNRSLANSKKQTKKDWIDEKSCAICEGKRATESENKSKIRREFCPLNWTEIDNRPFVLVSFGSIAKVEFAPNALLRIFLHAFNRFPTLVFIWQTNSAPATISSEIPDNVRIHRWAPIIKLLAHPNMRYAILHGGVNTINEALIYGAKPILGLPLQGDQPSNLQRLVDLGMAELVDIGGVWEGELGEKMAKIEQNYEKYSRRARKVSEMVNSFRDGPGAEQQNFWLRWATNKRHILKRRARNFFDLFYRTFAEYFMIAEFGAALALFVALCAILSH